MHSTMMDGGTEWLVDASGCRAAALRDRTRLRQLCEQIIADLDLHVIGEGLWRLFPAPGGVTGLYLLTESHLACHTYPESGLATFNLYCCRARPLWSWEQSLRRDLGANRVQVQVVRRGDAANGGQP
ncbi:MAG TPA: S-adenosylmethionine decarboxylase [Gemmataceae bacterium]|nr:S-adenosylmethionine decarboxylase [Gemmataceae bacterium]